MTTDGLTAIATCADATEAALLKGFLESEGLFCYVQGETHRQMIGVIGAYIEPRLMVRAEDAESARALVERFRAGLPDDDELEAVALEFGEAEPEPDGPTPYRQAAKPLVSPTPRPRSPRRALLVGLTLGFGLGHRAAGAPWRGAVVACADIATLAAAVSAVLPWGTGLGVLVLLRLCDGVGGRFAAIDHNRALVDGGVDATER